MQPVWEPRAGCGWLALEEHERSCLWGDRNVCVMVGDNKERSQQCKIQLEPFKHILFFFLKHICNLKIISLVLCFFRLHYSLTYTHCLISAVIQSTKRHSEPSKGERRQPGGEMAANGRGILWTQFCFFLLKKKSCQGWLMQWWKTLLALCCPYSK